MAAQPTIQQLALPRINDTRTNYNAKVRALRHAIDDLRNAWKDYEAETGEQPVSAENYFLNESLDDFAARVWELWSLK